MSDPLSEGATVGVVGEHPAVAGAVVDAVVGAVEAAGRPPVVGSGREVLAHDPEVVVAVGEPALLSLVPAGVDAPVLPVDAGRGVRSVPGDRTAIERAVDRLVAGDWTAIEHPVIVADPAGARALTDLTLVSAEPAQISEFTVGAGDETVANFRADGVAVATPAGSVGYARAAGGPVLAPDVAAVVVVPVAPYAIDVDHWVLPVEAAALTVERDEIPVELLADDRSVGTVAPGESVTFRRDGTLAVAVVEESRSFYARESRERRTTFDR